MSRVMQAQQLVRTEHPAAADHLATASDHLEAALETVTLQAEPELAQAVADAVSATDRALQRSILQQLD